MTSPSQARMLDAPELNTDETFIIVEDFVTAVVGAFMPEAEPWCERGPGMDLPGGAEGPVWRKVRDQIKKDDQAIFAAMKASNLYPEIPKAGFVCAGTNSRSTRLDACATQGGIATL